MTTKDLGEFPDERTIAILRGLVAKEHRDLHAKKNRSSDREYRDAISEEMRELEDIAGKLGRWL